MSKLARFKSNSIFLDFDLIDEKGNKVTERLEIKPFKTTDMELLTDMGKEGKQIEAMHKIIKKILKENIPDFTEEEYKDMNYTFIDKILNAVMEVNGLNVSEAKQQFLAEIKAKQQRK